MAQYVFYNTTTEQTIGNFRRELYSVYGVTVAQDPSLLPPDWVELEVKYAVNPPKTETQVYEYSWARNGTFWEQTSTVREMTPEELEARRLSRIPNRITKAQFFKACWVVLNKERDEIVTILNNIADTAVKRMRLIELVDEPYIERNSDFTLFIQTHFGYTDLQVDNFFTTAQTL